MHYSWDLPYEGQGSDDETSGLLGGALIRMEQLELHWTATSSACNLSSMQLCLNHSSCLKKAQWNTSWTHFLVNVQPSFAISVEFLNHVALAMASFRSSVNTM